MRRRPNCIDGWAIVRPVLIAWSVGLASDPSPSPAQGFVSASLPGAELGLGLEGSTNGFPNVKRSVDVRYRQWARIPLSGSVLHTKFLSYSLVLRPTWSQGATNGSSRTVHQRQLGVDASARFLQGRGVSLLLARSWASALSSRGDSRTSDFTSSSTGATALLNFRPFPVTAAYGRRSVDQSWFASSPTEPLRQTYAMRSLRFRGSSTKTSVLVERIGFDDVDDEDDYAYVVGEYRHTLRWGKGSQLASSLGHSVRTNSSPHRRLEWEERLRLQHLQSLSSDYFYGESRSRDLSSSTQTRSFGMNVRHRPAPWIGWSVGETSRMTRVTDHTSSVLTLAPGLSLSSPWRVGPRVMASVVLGFDRREGEGRTRARVPVVDERHVLDPTRLFRLESSDVDPGTVSIRDSELAISFVLDLDYQLDVIGGTVQVFVPVTSRVQVGDTLRVDYQYLLPGSRTEETVTTSYTVSIAQGPLGVRHRQSTRDLLTDVPRGPLGPPDFRDMTTSVEYSRRIPGAQIRIEARQHRRSSDVTRQTVRDLILAITPRAWTKLSTSLNGAWSRSTGDRQRVTAISWNGSAAWATSAELFLRGQLDFFWLSRLEDGFERSLGASVDMNGRIQSLETTLRYGHRWREFGRTVTEDRFSLRLVRRF